MRRTNWLSHLTNILDGVLIVIRTVHLYNSHVLVHCSDGWDRTSQLSALPQLCLDPYFRTARGFAVLVEKDWISYGHRFADRSGHLCNDRVDFVQKTGADVSTQQAFLASVTRQFASSSHAFKETCPVFQQFLDCVYQIQRQFPDRFEWNEQFLRHLVHETYAGATGSFLFNSEKDRADLHARTRTTSVWEAVFDVDNAGELELKPEFRNPDYNPSLDNPDSKAHDADQGVLLFDPQNVRWWFELFGRSDDEMNGRPFANDPLEPTITEVKVVESPDDDPVMNGLAAQASSLAVSDSPLSATGASSSNLAAASPPSRSSSPASTRQDNLLSQQQLSETVASVQKIGWSAWKSVRKFGEDAARQLQEQQAKRAAAAAAEEAERRESGYASDERTAREAGGGMWSKLSTSNPWASPADDYTRTTPSASSGLAYKSYQPRHAPPSLPSTSLGLGPTASAPAIIPSLPQRAQRQPSSTLSINPWETVSREEAIQPGPAQPAQSSINGLDPAGSEGEGRNSDPLGVGLA